MERNIALTITAVVLLAIGVAILMPGGRQVDPDPKVPWKIEVHADGTSSVFGLTLGHTTLSQIQALFDSPAKLTLFAPKDARIAVEAYFERVFLSGLRADMVMNLALSEQQKQAMYERGIRISKLGSGDRKVTLHPADIERAQHAAVHHITYLPMADLEPELLEKRFGPPAERIATRNGVEHWLYPEKGLDIAVDPERKEVFQYVAPKDFQRLVVEPLRQPANAEKPG